VDELLESLRRELAGRYAVDAEIGYGGMAVVFVGTDLRHDRQVAIKVLRPELASEVSAQRFLREIRVAARLRHAHILPLFDSGAADDLRYFVMPFVAGESVRHRLLQEERLPLADAVRVAREVADALGYAHAQGFVHRDIKPENILLDGFERGATSAPDAAAGSLSGGGWHALVADFGIARAVSDASAEETLTRAGVVIGTPAYMSPEQASGEGRMDGRSDIYSLGCVLYEMLAGEPPFTADSVMAMYSAHMHQTVPDVCRTRRDVPRAVADVIGVALAKSPVDRFATAGEFAAALSEAAGEGSSPTRARRRRRRARLRTAVAASVIAGLGAGATLLARPSSGVTLSARDQVLIAEFENSTGDVAFDRSLVLALGVGLQESPRISVLSRSQVREVMARAGRPAAADSLSESVAREVALRARARVVIAPAIARIDSAYVFTARVVDPSTGEDLATETVRVDGRANVLAGLDRLAGRLRRALGEPLFARVQPRSPLDHATSSSIDALKRYTEGQRAWNSGDIDAAAAHWREAVLLDSNFVRAHADLAGYHYLQNDRPSGERHARRALAQLARLPARERLWVEAYVAGMRGDEEGAILAWRTYLAEFPYDAPARFNLGNSLMRLGRCRESLAAFDSVLALDSTNASAHINSAVCHVQLREIDSAIAEYRVAFALRPGWETSGNLNHEYGIALIRARRLDDARRAFEKMLSGTVDQQARGYRSLALLEMYGGRYDSAAALLRQAIAGNRASNAWLSEYRNLLFLAAAHRRWGRSAEERSDLRAARAIFRRAYIEPGFLARGAEAMIAAGDVSSAAEMRDSAARRASDRNSWDRANVEIARAAVMLAGGDGDAAVRALEVAVKLDSSALVLAPLARAYATVGRARDAEEIYRQLIQRQEVGWERQEDWVDAHLALGRLAEARRDTAEALQWYDALLALWQHAGDDVAAVRALRRQAAALRGAR